jgi:hypothetical protein
MDSEDSETEQARNRVGRKAQVGGALAAFIGVLLLLFGPSATPRVPLNPHQMAYVFIGLGIFLVLVGTVARMILLD